MIAAMWRRHRSDGRADLLHQAALLADPGFDRAATAAMRVFISGSAPLLEATFETWKELTGGRRSSNAMGSPRPA